MDKTTLIAILLSCVVAVFAADAGKEVIYSNAEQNRMMVAYHNSVRKKAGVLTMATNAALVSVATSYNAKCQYNNPFPPGNVNNKKYGANMYAVCGIPHIEPQIAFNAWYSQGTKYNCARKTPCAGQSCSQYTRMMWNSTRQIGCDMRVCVWAAVKGSIRPSDTALCSVWTQYLCVYTNPGNWMLDADNYYSPYNVDIAKTAKCLIPSYDPAAPPPKPRSTTGEGSDDGSLDGEQTPTTGKFSAASTGRIVATTGSVSTGLPKITSGSFVTQLTTGVEAGTEDSTVDGTEDSGVDDSGVDDSGGADSGSADGSEDGGSACFEADCSEPIPAAGFPAINPNGDPFSPVNGDRLALNKDVAAAVAEYPGVGEEMGDEDSSSDSSFLIPSALTLIISAFYFM